jgi:uridine kinase
MGYSDRAPGRPLPDKDMARGDAIRRYVVGVAGAAGAGKTSLVQGLVRAMDDAAAIHIDSYQRVTREPIRKIVQWLERGADFDEFSIPLLPEHLEKLKRGDAIIDPVSMLEIPPRKYILFETHFGRAHQATGRHIDLLLWLDTPLDVALARNLKDLIRPLLQSRRAELGGDKAARLHDYLESYLTDVRRLVLMQKSRVGADADVIVDGSGELAVVIDRVRQEILIRLP